jgi:hypothetical protein
VRPETEIVMTKRWCKSVSHVARLACLAPLVLSWAAAAEASDGKEATDTVYLFTSFRDPDNDALHLAWSDDGYRWTDLGGPFLRPQVGEEKLIRDPSVCRTPDGVFHLVWTTGWTEKGIGYANSKDLVHWSSQKFIRIMDHEPTTMNTWAPEVRYDAELRQFLLYWSSTIPGRHPGDDLHPKKRNHRIYYSTTPNFETFTPTKVLFDPGYSVIDAILVDLPDGQGFAMVFKDERRPERKLRAAFAPKLLGPYSGITEPFTAHLTEGPTALRLGDKWIVYYDDYNRETYGAAETRDFKTWTDVSDRISFPRGHKHGTVFTAPRAMLEGLKRHAGEIDKSAETRR